MRIAAQAGDMDSKIGLLEASRETFRGTPQANDLEVRISALHARKRQAVYIVPPKTVKKATGTDTEQPVESGPYVEPDKVKELVAQRRYAEAASLLRSITRHPVAKLRIEELTMQASLFADLVAKAKAEPAIFQGVLLPDRLGRANMVGADTYCTLRATMGSSLAARRAGSSRGSAARLPLSSHAPPAAGRSSETRFA